MTTPPEITPEDRRVAEEIAEWWNQQELEGGAELEQLISRLATALSARAEKVRQELQGKVILQPVMDASEKEYQAIIELLEAKLAEKEGEIERLKTQPEFEVYHSQVVKIKALTAEVGRLRSALSRLEEVTPCECDPRDYSQDRPCPHLQAEDALSSPPAEPGAGA